MLLASTVGMPVIVKALSTYKRVGTQVTGSAIFFVHLLFFNLFDDCDINYKISRNSFPFTNKVWLGLRLNFHSLIIIEGHTFWYPLIVNLIVKLDWLIGYGFDSWNFSQSKSSSYPIPVFLCWLFEIGSHSLGHRCILLLMYWECG